MSASGPVRGGPNGPERLEESFGTGSDLGGKIVPRVSPDEMDAGLRRPLHEASHHPAGMLAEQAARRFRVGEVPPLAEGYTERPDTARGVMDALVPGSTVALVPGTTSAEGSLNWRGACGKTQIAVIIAESLWRSGAIDALIWISATNRAAVLSWYVRASAAATGIEPTGTAESVAARFISWLSTTSQSWLVVLDDALEASGPGRTLAGGADGPAADHQHTGLGRLGATRGASHPDRLLQRARSAPVPDRTSQRQPGPAARRYRPDRGARPRAAGSRPGLLGPGEVHPDLSGLPRLFRPPAPADRSGSGRGALGRRGHLDALPGTGRIAASRRVGPAHAGPPRPARRPRDPRNHPQHAVGRRVPGRSRHPVLFGRRPQTGLGRAARLGTGRPD